ncbi:hypothetical protein Sjap_019742 [Stephania japonica]|uniref:Uncharacterized protein n=1 Tax=Stephania japonica TaxID=461633 RepID=A0AAP0F6P2_9MAGN
MRGQSGPWLSPGAGLAPGQPVKGSVDPGQAVQGQPTLDRSTRLWGKFIFPHRWPWRGAQAPSSTPTTTTLRRFHATEGSPAAGREVAASLGRRHGGKVGTEGCEIYPSFGPMLATAPLTGLLQLGLGHRTSAGVIVRPGGYLSPSSIRDAPPRRPQLLFVVPLFADSLSPFLSPILGRHFSSPLCVVVKEARVYN